MIADHFRIGCSAIHTIMAAAKTGSITANQSKKVADYQSRDSLTDKQQEELDYLIAKRDAAPELPQGAKTVCEKWFIDTLYGRKSEFTSKTTSKGDAVEDAIIDRLAKHMDRWPFMAKHEESYLSDGYIQTRGCDVLEPDLIADVKASWRHSTFPLLSEVVDKGYKDQLNGYGHLYKRDRLILAYGLENMPDDLVHSETSKECYRLGIPYDEAVYDEIKEYYTYDGLPPFMRLKTYEFQYDEARIKEVHERVKMCREYIRELERGIEFPRGFKAKVIKRIKNGRRAVSLKGQILKVA